MVRTTKRYKEGRIPGRLPQSRQAKQGKQSKRSKSIAKRETPQSPGLQEKPRNRPGRPTDNHKLFH
jgi:hypothetical protein